MVAVVRLLWSTFSVRRRLLRFYYETGAGANKTLAIVVIAFADDCKRAAHLRKRQAREPVM
ncbi:MAG: hypothetical protein EDR02_13245 [Actinobacteria bacterium]|nr:MAG: hypothetical protein EDR02_13245 [Actinomycetota bacterium]